MELKTILLKAILLILSILVVVAKFILLNKKAKDHSNTTKSGLGFELDIKVKFRKR